MTLGQRTIQNLRGAILPLTHPSRQGLSGRSRARVGEATIRGNPDFRTAKDEHPRRIHLERNTFGVSAKVYSREDCEPFDETTDSRLFNVSLKELLLMTRTIPLSLTSI